MTKREGEAEAEAIFRSIGEGAVATDQYGHITRVNPAALDILGLKYEEVVGQWYPNLIVAIKPDNTLLPLIDRPIFKMFLSGKPVSEKLLYRVKQGRIVPVDVTVSPIMIASRPVGAIEVFRDITEENAIDRMKSEFISLASHQLRTPLSTIKTYAHMLIEGYMGEVTPAQSQALKTITGATNNMNELIGTLLNISRIESGSIKVNRQRHDVRLLVEDVTDQLIHHAKSKQITINLQLPRRTIIINTDSLIIKEILTNLINNAIKYTPKKGKVTVGVGKGQGNNRVLFTVQDTGLGIPKGAQNKIFSKFFRANNVIAQETSGTGLGLYVVKELVKLLQGKIWFESVENNGTTFYVELPKNNNRKIANKT